MSEVPEEEREMRGRITNAMIKGYNKIIDELVPRKQRTAAYQRAWNVAVSMGCKAIPFDSVQMLLLDNDDDTADFFYEAAKKEPSLMREICGKYANKALSN